MKFYIRNPFSTKTTIQTKHITSSIYTKYLFQFPSFATAAVVVAVAVMYAFNMHLCETNISDKYPIKK